MRRRLRVLLISITYGGANIGDDLTFRFLVDTQTTELKLAFSHGTTENFNETLLVRDDVLPPAPVPPVVLNASVAITESDIVYPDRGSGLTSIVVDAKRRRETPRFSRL